ncbi:uncharacterized protein LOC135479543 [Liolophura sinensis]|uniref:uncharacterized protein LOC135479543 n=1 Tax=Liolophura sinensis TaxID=3198878 RepID=UPI0031590DC2
MKVFIALTACLFLATGSDAFLGHVGDFFKDLGHDIGQAAKPIGEELLGTLENTGKSLLSQTVQDLLLHLGNVGKRETDLIQKAESFIKGVESFISNKVTQFKTLFGTVLNKLSAIQGKISNLSFLTEPINNLIEEIEHTVAGHNAIADSLLGKIVEEAHSFLKPLLGDSRRGILDNLGLNQIGQSLANLFKPHIDSLKTLVSSAGNTLKQHATNLMNAVKGSVNELGTKLQTHVDTLKTHLGTITSTAGEALATLKDAVGQVMQDTFSSLHNPVSGIVNTLTNAAGTVVNHVSSKLTPTQS